MIHIYIRENRNISFDIEDFIESYDFIQTHYSNTSSLEEQEEFALEILLTVLPEHEEQGIFRCFGDIEEKAGKHLDFVGDLKRGVEEDERAFGRIVDFIRHVAGRARSRQATEAENIAQNVAGAEAY